MAAEIRSLRNAWSELLCFDTINIVDTPTSEDLRRRLIPSISITTFPFANASRAARRIRRRQNRLASSGIEDQHASTANPEGRRYEEGYAIKVDLHPACRNVFAPASQGFQIAITLSSERRCCERAKELVHRVRHRRGYAPVRIRTVLRIDARWNQILG